VQYQTPKGFLLLTIKLDLKLHGWIWDQDKTKEMFHVLTVSTGISEYCLDVYWAFSRSAHAFQCQGAGFRVP